MNSKNWLPCLLAVACLLLTASVSAEPKPRWVQKGVASLNRERSNESYCFVRLGYTEADATTVTLGRFEPLLTYVSDRYRVSPGVLQLDSLDVDGCMTYRVAFPSESGTSALYARLVDEWSQFEEGIGATTFDLCQLYALSEPDRMPQFDTFRLTRRYPAKAALLSLVPGMGQLYKGQRSKGYAILGSEAVLLGGALYAAAEVRHYNRQAQSHPDAAGSYRSKTATYRQLRNFCLVTAGGLYLYNLLDAAFAKGARRVVVNKTRPVEVAVVPVLLDETAGLGVALRF